MKLKNILWKTVLCGCLAGAAVSCNFLETTPHNFASPDTYYRNQEDCSQALSGIYWTLAAADVYGDGLSTRLFNTDDLSYSRQTSSDNVANNTHFTSNEYIWNTWRRLYKGIDNANMLLQNIDKAEIPDEAAKNAIKGEAQFLRAYFYFLLVENWYEVPVRKETVTDINNVELAGTPHLEAMEWIIGEMEAALLLVDNEKYDNMPGRVKKTVVDGILARVYLFYAGYNNYKPESAELMSDEQVKALYTKALEHAQAVKESGKHKLVSTEGHPENIELIWRNMCADKYEKATPESMWEVEFTGLKDYTQSKIGAFLGNQQDQTSLDGVGFAYSYYKGTPYLWDLFEDGDLRKDLSLAPYRLDKNGKRVDWPDNKISARACGKFRREWETFYPKNKNYTTVNFPLLRYADVLLMIAEAENFLNGPTDLAYGAINEVRERAGVAAFSGLDKEAFQQAVMDERGRELCFEAIRKGDLIRWGKYYDQVHDKLSEYLPKFDTNKEAAEVYVNSTMEKHRFLPIPLSELSVNGRLFQQNEFWR